MRRRGSEGKERSREKEKEQREMNDDPIPDDYISAAAAVVEAARKLDEARRKFEDANKAVLESHIEQSKAEKALWEALEKLKQSSTGRAG